MMKMIAFHIAYRINYYQTAYNAYYKAHHHCKPVYTYMVYRCCHIRIYIKFHRTDYCGGNDREKADRFFIVFKAKKGNKQHKRYFSAKNDMVRYLRIVI